jgi:glycosyltransferase involved in cell wall biosynthesis
MTVANEKDRLSVLAVCAFPVEAAATRFRLAQFVEPLKRRGIDIEISPFLNSEQFNSLYVGGGLVSKMLGLGTSVFDRLRRIGGVGKYDVLLVQREATIFGPAVFEWLYAKLGRLPLVLDLDDATYVHYISPTYGRLGSFLKFFGKTDNLIRRAELVTCGNRFIAEYVESKGTRGVVVPTVVDLEEFRPREERAEARTRTVGWIGTHSTYPFLESLFPVLQKLAERHKFKLKIVGAGSAAAKMAGVEIENLEWKLEREVEDFRSLDIGLYPIVPKGAANEEWIKGKSGFKAIQYMAVGVPFVMSPVGICAEIGVPGQTHFNAVSEDDWYNALDALLRSPDLRQQMGIAAREHARAHYGIEEQADKLAGALRRVARQ